jgi:hypothetical protein
MQAPAAIMIREHLCDQAFLGTPRVFFDSRLGRRRERSVASKELRADVAPAGAGAAKAPARAGEAEEATPQGSRKARRRSRNP